jgi:hypothetical protein
MSVARLLNSRRNERVAHWLNAVAIPVAQKLRDRELSLEDRNKQKRTFERTYVNKLEKWDCIKIKLHKEYQEYWVKEIEKVKGGRRLTLIKRFCKGHEEVVAFLPNKPYVYVEAP